MIATGLFAEKIPGFDVISEDGAFKGGNGGILAWNLAGSLSICLLYTSPSPRDKRQSRMPSSA